MGMRVLFTAKHPPGGAHKIGGVLSWIETMAAELRCLGHDCEVWGPELAKPEGRFDLGVIANATATDLAAQWCDRVIGVTHGVVRDEMPNPSIKTVFTSEEVRTHWKRPDAPILRQPIDLDFWSPGAGERENLLTFFSYRAPSDMGLDRAALERGMGFLRLRDVTPATAREALRRSRIVAASGRAALEAMACGAAVMICDHRAPYQGPLMDFHTEESIARNYSGRGGAEPDAFDLGFALAMALDWGRMRYWVEAFHDARKIAAALLVEASC